MSWISRTTTAGAWLLTAAALAAGTLAPRNASAQAAVTLSRTAPRVLSDITDTVKDDDGAQVTLRTVLTYAPVSGEYVYTVSEADGRVRSRDVRGLAPFGPTAEEEATAQALVALHPDLALAMSRARHPVRVQGGFSLAREAGHACGPGSRCVQYEVVELVPGEPFGRRLRYVVVDLRAVRVLAADFDPAAEGNLAHPAATAPSRAQ